MKGENRLRLRNCVLHFARKRIGITPTLADPIRLSTVLHLEDQETRSHVLNNLVWDVISAPRSFTNDKI